MNRRSGAQRAAYRTERDLALRAFADGRSSEGWRHLERAHVIAQPHAVMHIGSHIAMLQRGLVDRDWTEVTGQALRALLAGPASVAGRIPTGNDGRARTPLSERMPIPSGIESILGDPDQS